MEKGGGLIEWHLQQEQQNNKSDGTNHQGTLLYAFRKSNPKTADLVLPLLGISAVSWQCILKL